MSVRCDGCGMDFTADEVSAYLDRVLCPKCQPPISLEALRKTPEHSPYMAFALSMIFPGAGHAYAGRLVTAYVLNAVVNLSVVGLALGTLAASPRAFLVTVLAIAVVLPLAAIAIATHASKVSLRVRKRELPVPPSLTPLWVFLAVGGFSLAVVAAVLFGCVLYVMSHGGLFGAG